MKPVAVIFACVSVFVLAACQRPVSVVSAHSAYGQPYVSKQHLTQREYVSALMAAKAEEKPILPEFEESAKTKVDDFPVKRSTDVSREGMRSQTQNLSLLWGRPAGVMGQGVTLMNAETRRRLNDALATTPMSSEVRFSHAGRQFIFMPNSEVYQPYRSGGRCRDGIVIHFDGQIEEQVRGLFCQQGVGVDWLLLQ